MLIYQGVIYPDLCLCLICETLQHIERQNIAHHWHAGSFVVSVRHYDNSIFPVLFLAKRRPDRQGALTYEALGEVMTPCDMLWPCWRSDIQGEIPMNSMELYGDIMGVNGILLRQQWAYHQHNIWDDPMKHIG